MKRLLTWSLPLLSTGLLLTACGSYGSKTSSSMPSAATAAPAAEMIDAKLFYDFSVKPLNGLKKTVDQINYYAELKRDSDSSAHNWTLWIERGHAEGFDHGHWALNLEDGGLSEYFVHSGGGRSAAAPAKGGNVVTYMDMLKKMQNALITMQAPADTLTYVANVVDTVVKEFPFGVTYLGGYADGRVLVGYYAAQPVDILVDVFHAHSHEGIRSDEDIWFAKGRTGVPAGSGSTVVQIDAIKGQGDYSCYDVKAVPVGGAYTQALAARTWCEGSRPE